MLPLNDLSFLDFIKLEFHIDVPPSGIYTYYPNTTEVPEQSSASTHGRSFKIFAEVDLTPQSQGVIVAQGSRFGGYSLFLKEGRLHWVYNFLGIPPEQQLSAPAPASGRHIVGVEFAKEGHGRYGEAQGTARLYVDDAVVDEGPCRTVAGRYSLCGEGLCVGYDSGDPVSREYGPRFSFRGGEIVKVVYDLADDQYIDFERQLAAAMALE